MKIKYKNFPKRKPLGMHALRWERTKRGMSQADVAKRLGVTQACISGIEKGSEPFTSTATALIKIFPKLTIKDFIQ